MAKIFNCFAFYFFIEGGGVRLCKIMKKFTFKNLAKNGKRGQTRRGKEFVKYGISLKLFF